MAYEHLVEKNEVYQPRVAHKCQCGYAAMTLRDLERHRQSGHTKSGGRGAFSRNRSICCCYCDDDVPYTVSKFSTHMLKVHGVKARLCLPVTNQCPFCKSNRLNDFMQHVVRCRSLFKPSLNLYYPVSIFDMPLMPKTQRNQPTGGTHTPVNIAPAGSNVPYNSSAVRNAALQASTPAVRGPAVVSSSPVPVALFTVVANVMGNAVRGAGFPAANVLPYVPPPSLPVMPVGIIGSRFVAPVSFPNVTSCTLSGQNPNVPSSIVTVTTTGTVSTSGQSSRYKPPRLLKQQAFGNVVLGRSTEVARSEILNNAGCNIMPSVSSLRDIRVQMPKTSSSFVASAFGQTSSVNARLPEDEDAQMRLISEIVDRVMNVPTSSDKTSSSGAKVASSCVGSLPASSQPSVSNALSRKPSRSVSSAESPVVILRRLSVSACEVCGSVFEKPQLLCNHLLKAHGIAVNESDLHQDSTRKPEQCVCCPLRFFSKQGLGRHMQIVHKLPSMKSCIRCAETGIADLIEHFRVKHGIPLRMMIEWRVCYLCKLNFTTVYEVEKHVVSEHKDIFKSRSQFARAVKASFQCRNRTIIQTPSNRVGSQNTGMGFSDIPGVVSRKPPHSVIEIDDDSCDLNPNDFQKAQDEKCKQQPGSTDAASPSKPGTTLHSPVNEPLTKKARISSSVSTDKKTDRSQTLQKQDPASVLERGAVLGTVSQITKNKRSGPVLVPLTEKDTSCADAASKPACVPDVSVRLMPLNSDLSVVQLTKESNKDGMGQSHHPGPMSTVNKKCRHTLITGDPRISDENRSDSKKVQTSDGRHKRQPDSEVIVVSSTTDTASHNHRNESSMNRKRSHALTTSDSHSSDLSRSNSKKVQSSDRKRKRQPDSEVIMISGTTDTTSPMPIHGSEPLRKKSRKSNGVSTGGLNGHTPGEKADHSKASSHRNEEPHKQHSTSAVEKGALITKEKRRISTDATSKTAGVSDVCVRLMPLSTSVTPLTNESTKSSGNAASKTHVSVHVTPSASLGSKESSVEKDKGRYRFVLIDQFCIT